MSFIDGFYNSRIVNLNIDTWVVNERSKSTHPDHQPMIACHVPTCCSFDFESVTRPVMSRVHCTVVLNGMDLWDLWHIYRPCAVYRCRTHEISRLIIRLIAIRRTNLGEICVRALFPVTSVIRLLEFGVCAYTARCCFEWYTQWYRSISVYRTVYFIRFTAMHRTISAKLVFVCYFR